MYIVISEVKIRKLSIKIEIGISITGCIQIERSVI